MGGADENGRVKATWSCRLIARYRQHHRSIVSALRLRCESLRRNRLKRARECRTRSPRGPTPPLCSAKTYATLFQLAVTLRYTQIIQIAASFSGLGMLLIAKGFRPDVIFGERQPLATGE